MFTQFITHRRKIKLFLKCIETISVAFFTQSPGFHDNVDVPSCIILIILIIVLYNNKLNDICYIIYLYTGILTISSITNNITTITGDVFTACGNCKFNNELKLINVFQKFTFIYDHRYCN